MSHYLIIYGPVLFVYTVLGLMTMYFLNKNVKKYEWVVLIFMTYKTFKYMLPALDSSFTNFSYMIEQFKVVSGFSEAYAKHMSYLYLEPLKRLLSDIGALLIFCLPIIICVVYYLKLHKNQVKEDEIRKMKIQDL